MASAIVSIFGKKRSRKALINEGKRGSGPKLRLERKGRCTPVEGGNLPMMHF